MRGASTGLTASTISFCLPRAKMEKGGQERGRRWETKKRWKGNSLLPGHLGGRLFELEGVLNNGTWSQLLADRCLGPQAPSSEQRLGCGLQQSGKLSPWSIRKAEQPAIGALQEGLSADRFLPVRSSEENEEKGTMSLAASAGDCTRP